FFTYYIYQCFNSVHFKIHVPEIIKHHIHTKTVFIHIHKPDISTAPKKSKPKEEPKKKKTHKEIHHEDWSSWSTYGYYDDHDDKSDGDFKNQEDDVHKEVTHKNNNPFAQYHGDSYMPPHYDKPDYLKEQHDDNMGYSYPPQYEVKEDVKEIDNNDIEPYMHTYEEGYHKGGESVMGHTYSGDVTKFYEDKHEKGEHDKGEHSAERYHNESGEKTHAGRYFVDDSEYQQNKKTVKRMRPKIFVQS
ncbi:uncharacterized protein LOC105831864, partial [Monomorium pharaonis]|uniref:uncharacterized protein LOC105831864 n=1 Tax=Monomorium pharaonis TaxID=307658 RepID=UPI00102E1E14